MDIHDFESACSLAERNYRELIPDTQNKTIEVISSGSIALDYALGIGGFPKGRITEIYGNESTGKTTMVLQAIAAAQKIKNDVCACYVDADHSFNPGYAEQLGVNLDKLLVLRPDNHDEKKRAAYMIGELASKGFDIMVIDSIAALIPEDEIRKGMEESERVSEIMNSLVSIISELNTVLLVTNQIRLKRNVMFSNPEMTMGGIALKYFASIRVRLRVVAKEGENIVGNLIEATVEKNKFSAPHKKTEFLLLFGEGIIKEYDIVTVALALGLVKKEGSTHLIGEDIISHSIEGAWNYLRENPKTAKRLQLGIREHCKNPRAKIF